MAYKLPDRDPYNVEYYRGLCKKTASMYCGVAQMEFEDVEQVLWVKCWQALESFNPARTRVPVQNYVFTCVRNQVKDLLKRKKHDNLHLEDFFRASDASSDSGDMTNKDRFEINNGLVEDEEEVYGEILAETPLIPSTLSANERRVVTCLYLEYTHAETAGRLGLSRGEVTRAVRSIKTKMEDWRPSQQPEEALV